MNYITGLSIGLSVGRKLYSLLHKDDEVACAPKTGFVLLHALSGRRRYQNSRLVGNAALAAAWQAQMLRLPMVQKVTMNTRLGTFLIEFTCSENHIERLLNCLSDDEPVAAATNAKSCAQPLGKVGMKIRRFFAGLNDKLRELSGQEWDLATLAAVIFTFMGLNKIITLRQVPSGPQLLWWAFGLLKGRMSVC